MQLPFSEALEFAPAPAPPFHIFNCCNTIIKKVYFCYSVCVLTPTSSKLVPVLPFLREQLARGTLGCKILDNIAMHALPIARNLFCHHFYRPGPCAFIFVESSRCFSNGIIFGWQFSVCLQNKLGHPAHSCQCSDLSRSPSWVHTEYNGYQKACYCVQVDIYRGDYFNVVTVN